MKYPFIYLASQSPRRRELLSQIAVSFTVINAAIDEAQYKDELPKDYVTRLAQQKAQAGAAQCADGNPVLGADTIVVLDQQILGKPRDAAHARDMLLQLSGNTHQVMTAVSVAHGQQQKTLVSISDVRFRVMTDNEIKDYCATEEPLDKAGAYAIQGQAAVFIEHLSGSYSGVMGLPLFETAQLFRSYGFSFV
ncbi:MAG: septum formation inhibitor Maf [Gammaproteobacteria bacterium]|nr:septum formation inhibitor Maf [Gammaproteobacteria bacterium]